MIAPHAILELHNDLEHTMKPKSRLEIRTRLRLQGEGRVARYIDKPKSSCPYRSKPMRQAWMDGWSEMDNYLEKQSAEKATT